MPRFRPCVSIIGLGSIGGSLGLALSSRGIKVIGFDSSPAVALKALRKGAIRRRAASVAEAAAQSDIAVVAVPVDRIVPVAKACLKHAKPGSVVTDVGSVKAEIVKRMGKGSGGVEFLGAHPMAGTEKSGLDSACRSMFEGKVCILTPGPGNTTRAKRIVSRMWASAGAKTVALTPSRHDVLAAKISHLPHALAAALMEVGMREKGALSAASGSFRDLTRVAESAPEMWRAIFAMNSANVHRSIAEFIRALSKIQSAMRSGGGKRLLGILRRASRARISLGRRG